MDEFFKNTPEEELPEVAEQPANLEEVTEETADSDENVVTAQEEPQESDGFSDFEETEDEPTDNTETQEYTDSTPVYNPVRYTEVKPIDDYKPMSKGLKIFAVIMAGIILITSACLAGYYAGKSSVGKGGKGGDKVSVNLASRPKDSDEMTEAQVYEAVNKSIVGIVVYNSEGKMSQASGIVYSKDGYIVTNDHIYSEIVSAKFKIYTHDGTEYDAKYVAGDVISDLAVLKVDSAKLEPAEFGNSDEIFHGEHVVAVGRPSDATDVSSITRGIISAVSRRVQTTSNYSSRLIQTDSAINPGSSGGALVNMYGQVIGVTSSKLASVEYDAVGYAIPTVTAKRIVEELISNGKVVSRAKLGITYTAIDSVMAEISGYETVGLYISAVTEDSDLYGKVEEGDIITQINGIEVTSDDVVLDIIEQSSAGDKISVTIVAADGATKTIEATLKANVGESSYSTVESLPSGENTEEFSSGGTFDFPFGE